MKNIPSKINLGCGCKTISGWINLDNSFSARLAKKPWLKTILIALHLINKNKVAKIWDRNIFIHDLKKTLPFPINHFQAIYISHVIEHLYYEDAQNLIKQCYQLLKKGGVLRLVTPDLNKLIKLYQNNFTNSAADVLNLDFGFYKKERSKNNFFILSITH